VPDPSLLYAVLKAAHAGSAALSLAGFVYRFGLMVRDSPRLRSRAVRVLPHVVDTVLLTSAILLAWLVGVVPGRNAWLTAKVVALLVYIVLGTIALKRGRTRRMRIAAGVAALLVFAYIVRVAITKSALGVPGL
jgi:uncharacterized membrane protein SirB2